MINNDNENKPMKILIVSATSYEIAPLIKYLDEHAEKASFFDYKLNGHTIYPLVTGVGALMTSFAMARYTDIANVDVAINAGVAGSYNDRYRPGDVVEVVSDRFADLGVEEADGSFTDVYQMGLSDPQRYPFDQGWITNVKQKHHTGLPQVKGLTVNKVHGTQESIDVTVAKYNGDVESMEGAGFMYAARALDMDFHQIRSISNMVEPRNKENWRIREAIDNLNAHLITFVHDIIK